MSNEIYDEKESFLLYTSFYDLYFTDLTNEEKGILIDCIFQYTLTGKTNFDEINKDRGLKVSFKSIVDAIDRNNVKWAESKKRRHDAAMKRWSKNKVGDSRTIEMPGDSTVTLQGNIANMPTNFDELKSRSGLTNYEEIRRFIDYCNQHTWCESLEVLKSGYDEAE